MDKLELVLKHGFVLINTREKILYDFAMIRSFHNFKNATT